MKRRLLVLALLAAPVAVRAQPADWQTVVGRDLRFRLEMPAPVKETKAAETEKGHASERLAWASKRDPLFLPGNFNNRILIDACIPYDKKLAGTFPVVVDVSPDLRGKLKAKFPHIFGTM